MPKKKDEGIYWGRLDEPTMPTIEEIIAIGSWFIAMLITLDYPTSMFYMFLVVGIFVVIKRIYLRFFTKRRFK